VFLTTHKLDPQIAYVRTRKLARLKLQGAQADPCPVSARGQKAGPNENIESQKNHRGAGRSARHFGLVPSQLDLEHDTDLKCDELADDSPQPEAGIQPSGMTVVARKAIAF
jgi:hypothetical protein